MNNGIPRIGCDVTSIRSIRDSMDAFGERYLDRIYTPLELAQSRAEPERVAARFAGKEAVVKILRPDPTHPIPYGDIEIALLPSGAPRVRLRGAARQRAHATGLHDFSISLSHDGDVAFATAIALVSSTDNHRMNRDEPHMTVDTIRDVISRYAGLRVAVDTLSDTDDLFEAGLASHATINVMLALEEELDVEFPDELLSRSTFTSIGSIAAAVDSLAAE